MRYKNKHGIVIGALIAIMILNAFVPAIPDDEKIAFVRPRGWPRPVYNFKANPITPDGFKLGRALFFDPVLSADSSISCVSCHLQFSGFTHGDHGLSHGINGLKGTRNSSVLFNLAWSPAFMWDGGVNQLDLQPLNPITNPVEMGSDLKDVLFKLNRSARYRMLFYRAFNDSVINTQRLLKSLAQFTLLFQSYQSKYDKVQNKEAGVAFTTAEAEGYVLFKQHCASCHTEPLFTNHSFRNNGLPVDTELFDTGRMKITQNVADSLKFKVPSLRNIAVSAPYMHDGRFRNLAQVITHYRQGIAKTPTLATQLYSPITLSEQQSTSLIAFLKTLTDPTFLNDYKFRNYSNP